MPVSGNGLRPPFLFLTPQKEKRAAAGPKRKNALARSGAVALRADVSLPSRCRLDLPAFCRPAPDRSFTPSLRRVFSAAVIGVENRMAFAPLLPARDNQRQRRSAQRVSGASPGRRFPQGQRVSVPDRRAGRPTFPRRRQEVRIYADRPAETFFLFHRARRILFLMFQKRMGGATPVGTAPGGSRIPLKGAHYVPPHRPKRDPAGPPDHRHL